MREKFREGWRASGYVTDALRIDHPDATVEFVHEKRGVALRHRGNLHDIHRLLDQALVGFPKASVYYHADSSPGYIAQLRCHCSHEKGRTCCKHNGHHRAKVYIRKATPSTIRRLDPQTVTAENHR